MTNQWKKLKQPSCGYILEWKFFFTPESTPDCGQFPWWSLLKVSSLPFCNEEDRVIGEF